MGDILRDVMVGFAKFRGHRRETRVDREPKSRKGACYAWSFIAGGK